MNTLTSVWLRCAECCLSQCLSLQVVTLLGSNRHLKVLVLGLLTKLVEGQYHLEDDTGNIQMDISSAAFHAGLC